MSWVDWAAQGLVLVGALNWGLIGLSDLDVVQRALGGRTRYEPSQASRLIYALVGLAAVYLLLFGRGSG